ncbi:M50 family metallopeptidase [Siminovitchia sp. FSL H7-0308]|uniref:M50 family metallopeptidase n=1 Tax=unclassified Siminovitchia TaxID=2837530 RepID=UPI0030D5D3EE
MLNNYGRLLRKIHFHPLFWIVACFAIITGYYWELLTLFLIVFIHEMGHATCAHFFSWKINRILIMPFGGICEVDEHGNRPVIEELLVVLAGPFQHIWMAATVFILGTNEVISMEFATMFQQFNIMVFLFNLLPVWPLDGGKVIYLYLSSRQPFLTAFKQSLLCSFIVLTFLLCLFLIVFPFNLNVWVVLVYLYASLWHQWNQMRFSFIRFLLERYSGKQTGFKKLDVIEVEGSEYVSSIMEQFRRGCKHVIHVDDGKRMLGKLDENEMLHAFFAEKQIRARLKDIVYHD